MRSISAIRFEKVGEPAAVVHLDQTGLDDPGSEEVTVQMEAAPIDPADLSFIRGRYGVRPTSPSGAGQSGVGRVIELGSGVDDLKLNDRVLIIPTGEQFTWQECLNVPASNVVTVNPDSDPLQLSTVGINQMTAYQLLEYADLREGDWVAQTAANSAVGSSVIALAHDRGLRTLNVVRRSEAVRLVSPHADRIVVASDDLGADVQNALDGQQISLLLAATGGPAIAKILKSLAQGGTVVSFAAVDAQALSLPNLTFGGFSIFGFWVVNWIRNTERAMVRTAYQNIAERVVDGTLHTEVAAAYELSDFSTAIRHASESSADGRRGKVFFRFS